MRGDFVRQPGPGFDLARPSSFFDGSVEISQIAFDFFTRQQVKAAYQDRGFEHCSLGAIEALKWHMGIETYNPTAQSGPLRIVFNVNDRKFGMRQRIREAWHRHLLGRHRGPKVLAGETARENAHIVGMVRSSEWD
jgi:hypothetical protein